MLLSFIALLLILNFMLVFGANMGNWYSIYYRFGLVCFVPVNRTEVTDFEFNLHRTSLYDTYLIKVAFDMIRYKVKL